MAASVYGYQKSQIAGQKMQLRFFKQRLGNMETPKYGKS